MSSIFSDTVGRINKDDCWLWAGKTDKSGHGRIYIGRKNGKDVREQAYRVMYEAMVGEIPKGFHLDHLCENPACINPTHLEPVSARENTLRFYRNRTHCRKGHPLIEGNFYWKKKKSNINPENLEGLARYCKACVNQWQTKPKGVTK